MGLIDLSTKKNVIAVLGPGPLFKGGLANYTVSLARAFGQNIANEVHLISWTQQYPAIIPRDFIDRTKKDDGLAQAGVQLHYLLDYNKPSTWRQTARLIGSLGASKLVIQWSIALQGLPLGRLVRLLRGKGVEVVFDLHFVRQKEESVIDGFFSRYALKAADAFVVHSRRTAQELRELLPGKQFVILGDEPATEGAARILPLYHPVYDMFVPQPDFDSEAWRQEMGLRQHVFLFFGFIRKYKGLHFCLEAFNKLAQEREDVSLLIVGESFWQTLDATKLSTKIKTALFGAAKRLMRPGAEDETHYNPLALIEQYRLTDKVRVVNDFVPNSEVYKYFQASDALLLFYEYATPSGVESMAYNFKIPILATAVGHFPETIRDGVSGYLAKAADTDDMARVMRHYLAHPIPPQAVDQAARAWTWANYARAIEEF